MQHNTNPIPNRTLFIHDNLDILRGMNSESVDLIATDPPFNKGRDFHATPDSLATGARFQDRWSWEADVHPDWVDSIKDDQPALYELIDFVKNGQKRDDLAAFLCWLGVRAIEMHRVLKPTGAIYLHCDPTAGDEIGALLKSIFGHRNLHNQIIWKRTGGRSDGHHWGNTHDIIYYATKSDKKVWNDTIIPPKNPKAASINLTGAKTSKGESGKAWRGYDPTTIGRHWSIPKTGRLADWIDANAIKGYKAIEGIHDRLDALDANGLIHWLPGGSPRLMRPAEADAGVKVNDTWDDIPFLTASNTEKIGYPTQKPVALYKRIIAASSNEGDLVLDPFCGCATTLIAAETLNRHWIGIDIWERAAEVLQQRIGFEVHARYEPPIRTDADTDSAVPDLPSINRIQRRIDPWMRLSHADMRAALYEAQASVCAGCGRQVEVEFMELDHILPRADGGANTIDNRVMLCSPCNRRKSNILTMSGLVRANRAAGWTQDAKRASMAADRGPPACRQRHGSGASGLLVAVGIAEQRNAAIERRIRRPTALHSRQSSDSMFASNNCPRQLPLTGTGKQLLRG